MRSRPYRVDLSIVLLQPQRIHCDYRVKLTSLQFFWQSQLHATIDLRSYCDERGNVTANIAAGNFRLCYARA